MSNTSWPGAYDNLTPTTLRDAPSLASVLNALQQALGTTAAWNFLQAAISHSGNTTDTVFSTEMTGDTSPRYELTGGGYTASTPPYAPAAWGNHNSPVGSGTDTQHYIEGIADTSSILKISYPRVWMTDGTNNLWLTFPATFPLTGSPNLTVSSTAGLASSGTLTVNSVYLGLNGHITYTSIVDGTHLGGCSSSGLTTNTDTSQRSSLFITDTYSAPILWVQNYGGMYMTDNYNFRYLGITTDPINDVMLGFLNPATRTGGAGLTLGGDGHGKVYRDNDTNGFARLNLVAGASTTVTLHSTAGLYPSSALNVGTTLNPWGTITCNNVVVNSPSGMVGQRVAYNAVAANMTNQPAATGTWALASTTSGTAPTITLPNDGHKYRVELFGTYWTSATNGDTCAIGVGASPTTVIGCAQAAVSNVSAVLPMVVLPDVTGSGQVLNVYTQNATRNGAPGLITIGASTAGSASVGPCSLAAYRIG